MDLGSIGIKPVRFLCAFCDDDHIDMALNLMGRAYDRCKKESIR